MTTAGNSRAITQKERRLSVLTNSYLTTRRLRGVRSVVCRGAAIIALPSAAHRTGGAARGAGRSGACPCGTPAVSYTHLRAHETDSYLVCRLLLEKKKNK